MIDMKQVGIFIFIFLSFKRKIPALSVELCDLFIVELTKRVDTIESQGQADATTC